MNKFKSAVARAKIVYYFKETFRAHSKAEYREIFSRGLNEDNSGVTGAFPFLYVRAFLALFVLFTVNVLVLLGAAFWSVMIFCSMTGKRLFKRKRVANEPTVESDDEKTE